MKDESQLGLFFGALDDGQENRSQYVALFVPAVIMNHAV